MTEFTLRSLDGVGECPLSVRSSILYFKPFGNNGRFENVPRISIAFLFCCNFRISPILRTAISSIDGIFKKVLWPYDHIHLRSASAVRTFIKTGREVCVQKRFHKLWEYFWKIFFHKTFTTLGFNLLRIRCFVGVLLTRMCWAHGNWFISICVILKGICSLLWLFRTPKKPPFWSFFFLQREPATTLGWANAAISKRYLEKYRKKISSQKSGNGLKTQFFVFLSSKHGVLSLFFIHE